MNRLWTITTLSLTLLAACGGGVPSRAVTLSQALSGSSEWLEYESAATRLELYRDAVHASQRQAGERAPVLFPVDRDGALVGAPGLDPRVDLLTVPDAGLPVTFVFDTRGDAFGDDRRDALQGLSEREATELVARSLLHAWRVAPSTPVVVMRAANAPYAAAFVDGVLRVNPSFVTMAFAQAQ